MEVLQLLLLVGFTCSSLAAVVKERDICDRPCYLIYQPVCGSDGVTYPNDCVFENARCRLPYLTSYPGPCGVRETKKDICDRPCYLLYDPVCGSDGVTYGNDCMFQNARCRDPSLTSYPGPCGVRETKKDVCDRPCYLLYDPVCGSNGVTYGNDCMFEYARCIDPALTARPGPCGGRKRNFLY